MHTNIRMIYRILCIICNMYIVCCFAQGGKYFAYSGNCFAIYVHITEFQRTASPPNTSFVRPVVILRIPKLRFGDSNIPGNFLWAWEVHPLSIKILL